MCAFVNYAIIGLGNDLSPVRQQPIIWTNDVLLSIRPCGTQFNETLFQIWKFCFNKMHYKISSAKIAAILSPPQCVKYLLIQSTKRVNITKKPFQLIVLVRYVLWNLPWF